VLLVLYWSETAVIGFWLIVRIVALPTYAFRLGKSEFRFQGQFSFALALGFGVLIFVQAGLFMIGHILLLLSMFAGPWGARAHGLGDFAAKIVIETGLWIPLLLLFIRRGLTLLFRVIRPAWLRRVEAALSIPSPSALSVAESIAMIRGFYRRIGTMQLALIVGAFVARALGPSLVGPTAPLIVLILLKTAMDLKTHLAEDFEAATSSSADPNLGDDHKQTVPLRRSRRTAGFPQASSSAAAVAPRAADDCAART